MDDLTLSVSSIFMFDDVYSTNNLITNLASNIHPRLDIYKKNFNFTSNQEERRKIALSEQKKKRQSLIESNREIITNEPTPKPEKKSPNKPKKASVYKQYTNQLMYSEWVEEIPNDLYSNWIMVLCPVGKRCLVVASEGITSVYNKAGKLIARHSSKLPGGTRDSKGDETILDCIYNDFLRTYFILDCLCWKSHPIMDSETEFRFYWLKCKLDETSGLNESFNENPYIFRDLKRVGSPIFGTANLSEQLIKSQFDSPFEYQIDGVLFYHKETHYIHGYTPLVGWLKPYMIPEILNIPMPKWVIDLTPSDYASAKLEMESFNKKEMVDKFKHKTTPTNQNNSNENIESDVNYSNEDMHVT